MQAMRLTRRTDTRTWTTWVPFLALLLSITSPVPTSAVVGGLPTSAEQAAAGELSHIVHVTSIGGVNHRAPYKGSKHVPADQFGSVNVTTASCAGVLLQADWVLLPARCVVDTATPGGQKLHPDAIQVRHGCGEHAPWSAQAQTVCPEGPAHVAPVAAVFVHPCWGGVSPLGDHDVALLRLESPGVPLHQQNQRYAKLDDGAALTSSNSDSGSGGAAAAGKTLLFRGFGRTGPLSSVSVALREVMVTISDGSRCVNKFHIANDHDEAYTSPVAVSPDSNSSSPGSSLDPLGGSTALDFAQRSICVGGDGLTSAAFRGGCPHGDEGGPLEDPNTGVTVGLWSRLTPAVPLPARHDLEDSTTSDHMLDDPTKSYCGGAGRGRFYDVFVRLSYYKAWIEATVRNRYDGGVCSAARILDSDLRCPPGAWADSEGRDPLLGLLGEGGALSSLASATAMAQTSAARKAAALASSNAPLTVTRHTAPTVATSAVCRLCPPGRYGARWGLETSDCSGMCEAGYFCAAGSTSPREQPCSDPAFHCPEGTAEKRRTVAGYVSVPNASHFNPNLDALSKAAGHLKLDPSLAASLRHGDTFHEPSDFRKASLAGRNLITSPLIMVSQSLCPKGHYCVGGIQRPCPQGTYGSDTGLASHQCSGVCFAGYYCPQQSIHPVPCPDGHWCDGNSSVPCPAGRYGEPGTKTSSTPGYTHTKSSLLGTDACSGSCDPGHYCPPGR